MILKRLFLLLLLFFSFDYAEDYLRASSIIKHEYVIKKLETAPVAYFGWEGDYQLYKEDLLKMGKFDVAYPSIYKAFIGWKEMFQERQKRLLTEAPEIYRKTFELHKKTDVLTDFYLIHNVIHVDLVYDKNKKTWHAPKPEESKKSIFVFGYVGPDILKDSTSWSIVHRLLLLPPRTSSWQAGNGKKHIYFLDGFSGSCSNFDNCSHENTRYFPYHLKYDVRPNSAIDVRERMESFISNGDYSAACLLADSADMSVRSKNLLKILNHDYEFIKNKDSTQFYLDKYNNYTYADNVDNLLETIVRNQNEDGSYCASLQGISRKDSALVCKIVQKIASEARPDYIFTQEGGWRFNMSFDVGKHFLVGNYSGVDPSWYLGVDINGYVKKYFFGIGVAARDFESKNDSCTSNNLSLFYTAGYLWLKTKYIESVAFGNLGFSTYNVSVLRNNNEKEYFSGSFFLYGLGVYFDVLSPNHIGSPSKGNSFVNRFGARLKLGFHNMNISDVGHVNGFSPYVSLGFTWLFMSMESKYQMPYKPQKSFLYGGIYVDYIDLGL
jgi:hypothetical protein